MTSLCLRGFLQNKTIERFSITFTAHSGQMQHPGGILPSNRMGWHFHDWIDYNGGCIFDRVTRMVSHIFGIWGVRIFWQVGSVGIKKY